MSLENVKAFYGRLANDEDFRNQIQNVSDKSECSQIVKAAGYDFTSQELEEYTAYLLELGNNDGELRDLNEKELEAVFGGATAVLQLLPYLPILLYGVVPIKYLY
ncbi:Nif11-like leader peptide family natural product precursor [Nostoc sp. TCL26-01]|uniref:Nif11-like leader peptide family natural product precursor n=1 Tax=Nostoc sp. TCL26-01 TaxID=2576904 RepID=UPI0015B90764|nr:Nif11-like leader peptide family natural product precursor [Nostoc sp. TCL26-01]QLE55851.1 Nif11-like leader peptide family natural product precursor [Nostoc sp. TCL26-01]